MTKDSDSFLAVTSWKHGNGKSGVNEDVWLGKSPIDGGCSSHDDTKEGIPRLSLSIKVPMNKSIFKFKTF